jgi:hypothetical protein
MAYLVDIEIPSPADKLRYIPSLLCCSAALTLLHRARFYHMSTTGNPVAPET